MDKVDRLAPKQKDIEFKPTQFTDAEAEKINRDAEEELRKIKAGKKQ